MWISKNFRRSIPLNPIYFYLLFINTYPSQPLRLYLLFLYLYPPHHMILIWFCVIADSSQENFPWTGWLLTSRQSVFMKGDRHKAENYRPVSLTSVACKMLEHIICRHLHYHLEKHCILTSCNHGLRSGHSCKTQLLTTMQNILSSCDSGNQTDIAILDFSEAFDTVSNHKLLHKLDHYGIRGPIYTWLSNFLIKRTMRVVLRGEASEEAVVDSGVPQGTVLGPLLFLCHNNDLPEAVKSTVWLFADVCLLYGEIRTFQDHLTLQEDLNSLERWAAQWVMKFNAQKCYILPTKSKSSYLYSLNSTILRHIEHNPYLGIQISSALKWSTHIRDLCKRAGSTLGFVGTAHRIVDTLHTLHSSGPLSSMELWCWTPTWR